MKIKLFRNILLYLSFFTSLNACNNRAFSVSESIRESKEIGVFIHEYEIKNVETLNHSFRFPVQTAWLELTWFKDTTENNPDPAPVIDSTSCPTVVFKIKDEQELDFLFKYNYLETWLMIDAYRTIVGRKGNPYHSKQIFNSCKCKRSIDTIPYTIYLKPHKTLEGLIPVFQFDLVRKEEK